MTTVSTSGVTLESRYRDVMERIGAAARRSGRLPGDILTIAVTKYADLEQIRELIDLGHRDLGESRVQQLLQRAAIIEEMLHRRRTMPGVAAVHAAERSFLDADRQASKPDVVRWHLIGHLQRNKVKKAIELSRLIHSVDSLRLVEEIQQAAFRRDQVVDVLVQVNCSGEASKFGCAVAAAPHLCEQIDTMVHLRVRGLMTMAPHSDNPEDSRLTFERCVEVYEDICRRGIGGAHFNVLSMGMSNDFEVAIECGSNMVRIGSLLFGEHHANDQTEDADDEG